ncbi:alpha/beta hydrolase [Allosaccharopolyspora coralli]|uniref:alpha/beta hydrolase n=1 Tax=Allosaccharopolyspora coralli TaxID=2665642 RepID=UPI001E2A6640|nr:alpha/beta hydrolase [Allosaccharopolyspora coralli]
MKKRILSTLAATCLLAGIGVAPTAAAAPQAPDYTPAPVDWGPCESEPLVQAGAECGTVEVPLDYDDPEGEKISLAVSRVKATVPAEEYQGVMLVNPGGPGGSGLNLAVLGGSVPKGAGDAYDWIGFDPRGVGSSTPAASCDPQYFGYDRPDYRPTTPELEKFWLDKSAGYADACKANGRLLDNIKTTDNVADMNSIRNALGAERINFYGFSYGTYLGQVFGTLYPDKLRRVVMDGVVNVEDVWYQANLNQDVAFEHNIQVYFDWIARYDEVFGLGTSGDEVEKQFYTQKERLDAEPAEGKIGSDEWTDLFLSAGYGQRNWETIAHAFSGWVHRGESAPLVELYDASAGQGDDNGYAMYLGTECTDAQWPTEWDQWKKDNWKVHKKAPFETWANAWYNAPCMTWPAEAGTPVEVDGSEVDSALLISEEKDGATPYAGALEARKRFPNASLISLPGGTTHSGSLGGNACLDDQIADYLLTGELPERRPGNNHSDTTCEPLPQPVPEGAQSAARAPHQQPEVLQEALKANHRR